MTGFPQGENPRFHANRNVLSSPAVKFLAFFLLTSLTAHAAASDPGKAAVEFLEKVRERKINLDAGGDTALSARTTPSKRRQIAKRLDRLAKDLGSGPLEIGAIRTDDDLAAVLVRQSGGFDPGNLRVFPVALVRRDAQWEVAPVPASFENAGAGYAVALRKRAEALETWMLRQQIVALENLHAQAAERMRGRISEKLSADDLVKLNVSQVADRFLAACASGDLATMLGLLGGLDDDPPDDWSLRLRSAEAAIQAGRTAPQPWNLLVSPQVASAVVLAEDDGASGSGLFSAAFLDPDGSGIERKQPRIEVVHFNLTKSTSGLWRINLPPAFLTAESPPTSSPDEGPDLDADLVHAFPTAWRAAHPAFQAATAETASQAWFAAVAQGDFPALLATLDLTGDPEKAAESCVHAARTWWKIRSHTAAALALPLSFQTRESTAAAIYQAFTPRDPDKRDLRELIFKKSDRGWTWQAHPMGADFPAVAEWLIQEKKRLAADWQLQLLAACPVVAIPTAATEAAARQCVGDCLAAIAKGDMLTALSQSARLDSPRSASTTLRNLGYEITATQENPKSPAIIAVYPGESITAVAVQSHLSDGTPAFPLYAVVQTDQGPRILMEIDLFASSNRSRSFLNKDALQRLADATSADAASDLRKLLNLHQSAVDDQP